jgi:hypothetical protein
MKNKPTIVAALPKPPSVTISVPAAEAGLTLDREFDGGAGEQRLECRRPGRRD